MTGKDKFRVFLEEAPDAFFAHDVQGRLTDVNRRACANLGYSFEELLGMSVLSIEQDFDLAKAQDFWEKIEPGNTHFFKGTHRRKDGTTFPVEVHASAFIQNGQKTIFSLVRDIGTRVLTETLLERQSKLYQALSKVNQAMMRMEDEKELLSLVCRMAVDFGGMRMAWIGQERGAGTMESLVSYGTGQEYLKDLVIVTASDQPEGRGPTAVSWRNQEIVVINDYQKDATTTPWKALAKGFGWASVGAFPISRKSKCYAILTVYHDQVDAFDDTIIRLLDQMTADVSYALHAFDQEALRKRAAVTVKAQNDFLKAIMESEPECVKVVSPSGKLVHMNPAGLSMLEVDSLREAQKIGLVGFIQPAYRKTFKEFHRNVCAGTSGILEFPVTGKKGSQRWLETHATPLRDAKGKVTALLGVTRDITEKKRTSELIWHQANYDLLTELPNRNMFYDRLTHEMKRAERDDAIISVLFIDLDRFKEVNDTLGHQTGDLLLREVARRIVSCVRKSDTVARLGGDEFTIILSPLRSTDHIEKIAQNILDCLAKPFLLSEEKGQVYISASIGISLYPMDATDVDRLMSNADQAMYAAKSNGRNRYSFYTHSLQQRAQSRLTLLHELRSALKKNQMVLHFQPVVNLMTGRINKAEALLRWEHPELGMVNPSEFIPLAEDSGLIIEIDDWVFREAARWVGRWAQRRPGFKISVNLSPTQFRNKVSELTSWLDYLKTLGVSGKNMVIEINETLLLDDDPTVNLQLKDYRAAHIEVAIDDFGTGYSSLSYISRFPIDYLKIDQSLVQDLLPGSQHHALSKAIIVMGHEMGFKVIAEGIETTAQRDMLRAAGCDFGQGFLFTPPLPAREFETRVFG